MYARKSIVKVALDSKTTKNPLSTLSSSYSRLEIFVNILLTYMDFEEFKDLALGDLLSTLNPVSEREDLNLRPLDPQSSALPNCATSRCN